MERKLLSFIGLLISMLLTAAPVTKDAARQKALQFLTERGSGVAASRSVQPIELQLCDGVSTDQLHVFNVGQQEGFVIISGDDCTGDLVLGYSDNGEITAENMPDNLRAWLQGYADQIKWMQEHGVKNDVAATRQRRTSKVPIAPLLTTQWNQGWPYNKYCPSFYENGTPAVTGCVATATGQVMFYQAKKHNIESTTTSAQIPSYYSQKYYWYFGNVQYTGMPAKDTRTFDWNKIDATLTTTDAQDEVAHMMEYVGAAVKMQYGPESEGGSSASNEAVVTALVDYFGYDPDLKSVYHDDYNDNDWVDIIYGELSTNGPVLLGGQSSGGGHAFVVDGYSSDENNIYFHINWGWGGLSDGNFVPSVLNPSSQGAGGSSSSDGYNYNQVAMVNVSPVDNGVDMSADACLQVNRWRINYNSLEWNYTYNNYYYLNSNYLYPLQISYSLTNNTGWDLNFEWSVALYNGDTYMKLVYNTVEQSYPNRMNRYGTTGEIAFTKLNNGNYRLVPVCRKKGTSTWHPCIGSDKFYINVTVSGDNMTLKNNPPIEAYDAYGWPSAIEIANGSVVIPDDVLAIDLTCVDEVITVTPNDNPNTLYFISGENVPDGLSGKNVVQNGTAAMITLEDGEDFYSPVDFTATKVTYTRQFDVGADGTNGWSTIVLPFNVTAVKQGVKPIDWFHSGSDKGKDFWLKAFSSETGSTVNFDFANELLANTPYIIAVPGNTWGEQYNLTNKDITFEGEDVTVKASTGASIAMSNYKFSGVTRRQNVTNCYVLNHDGNSFEMNSTTVDPFRAYFMNISSSGTLASTLPIGVERGKETAISPIGLSTQPNTYFNLQGQRISQPRRGLYIVNGKKIIMK